MRRRAAGRLGLCHARRRVGAQLGDYFVFPCRCSDDIVDSNPLARVRCVACVQCHRTGGLWVREIQFDITLVRPGARSNSVAPGVLTFSTTLGLTDADVLHWEPMGPRRRPTPVGAQTPRSPLLPHVDLLLRCLWGPSTLITIRRPASRTWCGGW